MSRADQARREALASQNLSDIRLELDRSPGTKDVIRSAFN